MKYLISLLFAALIVSFSLHAQDVIYTVSAEFEERFTSVDSILVENMANGSYLVLDSLPETKTYELNLTQKSLINYTGIKGASKSLGLILSKNLKGSIGLTNNNAGNVNLGVNIFNVNGQQVYSARGVRLEPQGTFEITLAGDGVFLVQAYTNKGLQSFKAMGSPKYPSFALSAGATHPVVMSDFSFKNAEITSEGDFFFGEGDSIRVAVFKSGYFSFPESGRISESKSLNFLLKERKADVTGVSDAYVELNNAVEVLDYNNSTGDIQLQFVGEAPDLKPGNIIAVDVDTMGHLRKIVRVSQNNGQTALKTVEADLSDVFVNKHIQLDTEQIQPGIVLKSASTAMDISKALTDENGYIHPVEVIYHDKAGKIKLKSSVLTNGIEAEKVNLFDINEDLSGDIYKGENIHFYIDDAKSQLKGDAVFDFIFDYSGALEPDTKLEKGELNIFTYYLKATYEYKATLKLDMTAEDEKSDTKKIHDFNKVTAKFLVGTVPVWITFDVDMFGKYTVKSDASVNADWGFRYFINSTAGGAYEGESQSFAPVKRFDFTETFTPLTVDGKLNVNARFELYPKIDILFYGFFGPVIELVPYVTGEIHARAQTQITTTETKNFLAWTSAINLGFDLRTGLKLSFLGLEGKEYGPVEFPIYNKQVWNAPDTIYLSSQLPEKAGPGDIIDLKFTVKDNADNFIAGCPVYISGEGEFSDELVLTNTGGIGTTQWIVPDDPNKDGNLTFTAKIFDVDVKVIAEVKDTVQSKIKPTITTKDPTYVTHNRATLNAIQTNNDSLFITELGFYYSQFNKNPNNSDSIVKIELEVDWWGNINFSEFHEMNEFHIMAKELNPNSTYYYRPYMVIDSSEIIISEVKSFKTLQETFFTDQRDGNVYRYVTIGSQTWMAENLRATKYADGTAISGVKFYNDDPSLGYGGLYRGYDVAKPTPYDGISHVQGVCPDGWHVPSKEEWKRLEVTCGFIEGQIDSYYTYRELGTILTSTEGWINDMGTDKFGFSALPAGSIDFKSPDKSVGKGFGTVFWSSSAPEGTYKNKSLYRKILQPDNYVSYFITKKNWYSVRCIKD